MKSVSILEHSSHAAKMSETAMMTQRRKRTWTEL
jgi:hypothetical protein